VVRFRHNDPEDLDRRLSRLDGQGETKLIVVEGIYSMLGDQAPLAELAEVKRRHGAYLLVDEAHSLGVLGEHGRGAAEAQGVEDEVDFVVGTFSKSLGAIGGFGASDHPKFNVLRFCSRPYMYTASSSPSGVASVLTALRKIREQPELRRRLWDNARALAEGLTALGCDVFATGSPIIAVRLPDEATAVGMWNRLLQRGVYVNLALPPGTPNGACLLRCSVSAAHTPAQITEICQRFADTFKEAAEPVDPLTATPQLRRARARRTALPRRFTQSEACALRSAQLVEQRLGALQVGGVKTFGEPVIDRREQVVSLLPLPLLGPQPR
jgi:8-amino-7-oxononanoate synthase